MKFFISSTYQDLKDIRRVAINTIESLTERKTAEISAMEEFPASQKSSGAFCVDQVKDADIVIGIYGYRFGSKYYDGRSMTEIEFDEAVEHGATILAFVAKDAENIAETDQQRFIKNKVHSLGGLCAMFDPDDLEGFTRVLNDSLKEYFGTLEGYSYHSVWDDINILKSRMEKEADSLRITPYGEGEELMAFEEITQCAQALNKITGDLGAVNDAVYNLAYNLYHNKQEYDDAVDIESEKEQTLKNIDENKASVLRNWEVISLGIPNMTTRILLAVNYLRLCWFQKKLLIELWTEELRKEIVDLKAYYMNQAENDSYLID